MKSTMKKVLKNVNFACLVPKLANFGQNILKDVRCLYIFLEVLFNGKQCMYEITLKILRYF